MFSWLRALFSFLKYQRAVIWTSNRRECFSLYLGPSAPSLFRYFFIASSSPHFQQPPPLPQSSSILFQVHPLQAAALKTRSHGKHRSSFFQSGIESKVQCLTHPYPFFRHPSAAPSLPCHRHPKAVCGIKMGVIMFAAIIYIKFD
jgi:hypothetical protein